MEAEALAETLSDRLEEIKPGKVDETLTDLKPASPVVTLDEGPESWKNTERCCAPGTGRQACCCSRRSRKKENLGHTNLCKARGTR